MVREEKKERDPAEERMRDRVQVIRSGEAAFPAQLKEIKEAPKTLYYIGDLRLAHTTCAAVVGSRTTTAYGRNTARNIGRCLAECGVTVVSGMASGIDTCAHEGALQAPAFGKKEGDRDLARTIAVLGCGPDVCYPAENRDLKEVIERRGLVLSEYPPGTDPQPYRFPERNRIISGLSRMVVVVQARVRSGALITAEFAADQGREILAVPGNIDSQYNLGTNQLIRDGAWAIASVEDVLEPLGLSRAVRQEPASLSGRERQVYQLLEDWGELSADEICLKCSCQPAYLLPILSALELKGFIRSAMGKFYVANI